MKIGTRSLLFGVHQFIIHPIVVLLAWRALYGWPSWKEMVCIIIHDWGYWSLPNMDGKEGERHPVWAAILAVEWLGAPYYGLCLYHSRHFARKYNEPPFLLCWADKLSITYEPWWLYLPRAWASGELREYRQNASQYVPLTASHREWYRWMQARFFELAMTQRADVAPYFNRVAGK